jgi:anti-sigma B factor antagonist
LYNPPYDLTAKEKDSMDVTTEHFKRCALVKATGRIDSQTAPELEQTFEDLMESGHYKIVFDMSEVDFVSSAGLRVIIDTQKKCRKFDRGELILAAVPERIYEALDLAGFVPLFTIRNDVLHAIGNC